MSSSAPSTPARSNGSAPAEALISPPTGAEPATDVPVASSSGAATQPAMNVTVNANVTAPAPQIVVVNTGSDGPGLFGRVLYFLFVGWWLSFFWAIIAWFFIDLIVTIPLGIMMLNKMPKIATLKEPKREFTVSSANGVTTITRTHVAQYPMWARAIYFVFVGWWFSFVWVSVAWFASITLIGLPLAMLMYDRIPLITTLARY